jgi:hypothetical protein
MSPTGLPLHTYLISTNEPGTASTNYPAAQRHGGRQVSTHQLITNVRPTSFPKIGRRKLQDISALALNAFYVHLPDATVTPQVSPLPIPTLLLMDR